MSRCLGGLVGRSAELRAVADFLKSMAERPSALVIEGEAGIGKTTLWSAAVQQARERGFRVFSARASQVESVLAYAVVADLIRDVDCAALGGLPDVQRRSILSKALDIFEKSKYGQLPVSAAEFALLEESIKELKL